MLGGRQSWFIVFLTHNALPFWGLCSHTLNATDCKQLLGKVGETIEISPGRTDEVLKKALWKHNGVKVADKNADITEHQFTGRVSFNTTTYSLTVSELKTSDSGMFTFVSSSGVPTSVQRPTMFFRLEVQEDLAQTPKLNIINTTHVSNASCVVWLQCGSTYDNVSYKWTVNHLTFNGSTLQHHLTPEEGDTNFTCTVFNMVSETSASRRVNCNTSDKQVFAAAILGAVGVACGVLLIMVVGCVVFCRQRRARAASVADGVTVYDEIIDVTNNKITKPNSIYETVVNQPSAVKPPPQTVYDEIQFSRMMPQ